MIAVPGFTSRARRQSATQTARTPARTPARANVLKKRVAFFRRREASTFEKCLAVHMYYASAPKRLG